LCGDFNAPPWSGPFRRLEADAGLTDLYGGRAWSGYSWPTWNPLLRIPLDNCLVSNGLVVTAHRKGADIGSDHFPLVIDVARPAAAPPGPAPAVGARRGRGGEGRVRRPSVRGRTPSSRRGRRRSPRRRSPGRARARRGTRGRPR